eukprot:SAG31_NODE_5167_length_2703_cov_3.435100_4_plen_127_part_00
MTSMKSHILTQVGASSPSFIPRYHARSNIFIAPIDWHRFWRARPASVSEGDADDQLKIIFQKTTSKPAGPATNTYTVTQNNLHGYDQHDQNRIQPSVFLIYSIYTTMRTELRNSLIWPVPGHMANY